ncbi:MAG: GGDEF domain-containing protein [Solirubrobacterales bacterium]
MAPKSLETNQQSALSSAFQPRWFLLQTLAFSGFATLIGTSLFMELSLRASRSALVTIQIMILALAALIAVSAVKVAYDQQAKHRTNLLSAQQNLEHENLLLRNLAYRDGLTGLFNYSYFKKHLREGLENAAHHHAFYSVLMMDLDHFKQCNDLYGHQYGDAVLKTVGAIILHTIRNSDIAARYGGDEFGILLPGATHDQAMMVAERIRGEVEECFSQIDGLSEGRLSVSIGIGVLEPGIQGDPDQLLKTADAALYRAKNHRNWIELDQIA